MYIDRLRCPHRRRCRRCRSLLTLFHSIPFDCVVLSPQTGPFLLHKHVPSLALWSPTEVVFLLSGMVVGRAETRRWGARNNCLTHLIHVLSRMDTRVRLGSWETKGFACRL